MWKKLMLSCKKASELIDKKKIVPLSMKERIQLNLHKKMCAVCSMYDKQSDLLDKALNAHYELKKNLNGLKLDEEVKKRIYRSLDTGKQDS